ncbi:MAG: 2-hydroxyacyl-CoA dehydratase family protein [Syntrophorhabdaceae bacterium]|nr:2-hydroxyacyl-CoA dehydratase family protein [Syntrophorhabdaceae bacterium]
MTDSNSRVGFTTTIPVEILYAGGFTPVDLNNVFIGSGDPSQYIRQAETDGFPRNCCGWIKGIYGVALRHGFRQLIAVTQGDCSFTQALMEVLHYRGISVLPFAFPFDRDPNALSLELSKTAERFGTTLSEAQRWKARLDEVRNLANRIDRLTWEEGKVTGEENHLWLVSCSDFEGDPDDYARRAERFISEASARPGNKNAAPVAFVGVPPIISGLHACFEEAGARVVLNEVQRQFAMPYPTSSLVEQYLSYTYPYSFFERIRDIKKEIALRGARGVVHYVQSFCFRQIEDILLRAEVGVPVLTLEGESPASVDERTRIRIQAFVEMLSG